VYRVHSGRWSVPGLVIPIAMAIGIGGCASHADVVGTVTQISPKLCIGRHAAAGACYGHKADGLDGLRVGDCVQVTVVDGTVTDVEPVPAADHRDDCPGVGGPSAPSSQP